MKKLIKLGKYLYDHYALQVCILEGFFTCVVLILNDVLFSFMTETQVNRLEIGLMVNIIFTVYIIMTTAYTEFKEMENEDR